MSTFVNETNYSLSLCFSVTAVEDKTSVFIRSTRYLTFYKLLLKSVQVKLKKKTGFYLT